MLGFVFKDPVPLKVHEELVPVRFMRRDIKHKEVEHRDESEALIQLGERVQDPRSVIEPDGKQTENARYGGKDDYPNEPVERTMISARMA